jgi:flagellar assembly factor FliW
MCRWSYLDPENDYDFTTQTYARVRFPFQTSKSAGTVNYEAPIVVDADDALTIAGAACADELCGRHGV